MKKSEKYQDWLIEQLKDQDVAVAYLNAVWEESLKVDKESITLFLLAMRNVADAQDGYERNRLEKEE